MLDQISFVLKVFVASWLLSVIIKYSDRILILEANNINASLIVFTPCILMLFFLIWNYFISRKNINEQ